MKAIADRQGRLAGGLGALRTEFGLPDAFPPEAVAAARAAAANPPRPARDLTHRPFITLDPAGATDLDQAFCLERRGADLLLHYAIADVGGFVVPESALDLAAWRRGMTQYLPGARVPLYPPVLSEQAASLLPDGPRPAVVFTVAVGPEGTATLLDAERATIRSRAKLAYETVTAVELPAELAEFGDRIRAAEQRRGAVRFDTPQQELRRIADGTYALTLSVPTRAERDNAAMSLATNIAIADALIAARTGLFRDMAPPDTRDIARLRASAAARGIAWSPEEDLATLQRRLDPASPEDAAFLLDIRRAGRGALYRAWSDDAAPWHAAIAAGYAHATAPLRRLGDRYVIQAALALVRGAAVPSHTTTAFRAAPAVLNAADTLGDRLERAALALAEAVLLEPHVGERFDAVVTDVERGVARFHLLTLPVTGEVEVGERDASQGQRITVRLVHVDAGVRRIRFARD
jgi:exoribonuclease R